MEKEQKQNISELAALLHKHHLSELEYEADGIHIRVAAQRAEAVSAAPTVKETIVVPACAPAPAAAPAAPENDIVSPMVGVVYLAKDPAAPTFVKLGDAVSVGQTVCLIEAMKTFNPIKSTKAGKVTAILVETGSPVEYNQPLFRIG